jgi:hypothetical protein
VFKIDRTDSIPAVFVGRTYVCRNYPLFMLYVIGSLIPLTKVETSGDLKFEIEKGSSVGVMVGF